MMTSYCLAIDYDVIERACYVHGTATYCGDIIAQPNVNNFKRAPCLAGKREPNTCSSSRTTPSVITRAMHTPYIWRM